MYTSSRPNLIQTLLEKIDRHAAVVFLIEDILQVLVALIKSILQTAAVRISRGHRFVAALQYFVFLVWADWKEVAASQLPIQMATRAALKATRCHIPIPSGSNSVLQIHVDATMIRV